MKQEATKIISLAKEILDSGWTQHTLKDAGGNHCTLGSIIEAKDRLGLLDEEEKDMWKQCHCVSIKEYNKIAKMLSISDVEEVCEMNNAATSVEECKAFLDQRMS